MFKDETIYVWSSETIKLKCQFNSSLQTSTEPNKTSYKSFSISNDGKILVTGSRDILTIWNLKNNQMIRSIKIENKKTTTTTNEMRIIKDCCILGGQCYENKIVLVLQIDGSLDVYNIDSGEKVYNLNSNRIVHNQSQTLNEQKIINISTSTNGRFLLGVTQDGCIQCYDLDACSAMRSLKATSNLMKSTLNSMTISNETTKLHQQQMTLTLAQSKRATKNISRSKLNSTSNRRVQNLLENDEINGKLIRILKCFNEYPSRYRMFIWKVQLNLKKQTIRISILTKSFFLGSVKITRKL
jgi:WD40 repeat protein